MSLSFPVSPSVGQIYQGWEWNGSVWVAAPASSVGPLAIRVFTASGTYTPSPGMQTAIVECVGGGSGGLGVNGATGYIYLGNGGGSGGYSKKFLTAAQIGSAQTVTIGAGGGGGTASSAGAGGQTYLGPSGNPLCLANGGGGYSGNPFSGSSGGSIAGAVGDLCIPGQNGGNGWQITAPAYAYSGSVLGGANSMFGAGGYSTYTSAGGNAVGGAATGYGAGGAGAFNNANAGANPGGGAGAPGIMIITEFAVGLAAAAAPLVLLQSFFDQGRTGSTQTSTSGVMSGLANVYGWHLTPSTTGRLHVTMTGSIQGLTTASSPNVGMRYGTGTAPASGAAVTGTLCTSNKGAAVGTANWQFPFCLDAIITGLSLTTSYWFDQVVTAGSGAGVATLNNDISIVEF